MNGSAERGGQHLSCLDLDILIKDVSEKEREVRQLKAHLEGCPKCQKRMGLYRSESKRLELLAGGLPDTRRTDCPKFEVWLELAAGMSEDGTDRLLNHAASCGRCGAMLKDALKDLYPEEIPVEAGPALSPEFRRQLVEDLSRPGRRTRAFSVLRWVAAVAALIAPVAVWQWVSRPAPERLLARAYSANRTMEIRFPGSEYAPLSATKGPREESPRDASFVEAELSILRALNQEPESPKWLQLRSRMDLLQWQYDRAIATLGRLSASDPSNASIRVDLGNAYELRGTHQRIATDLLKAVELFSQVINRNEDSSGLLRVALFNRAIASERLFLWDGAAADWKRYLTLDSTSGWAREASSRLKLIEERKRAWRHGLGDHEAQPAEFLTAAAADPNLPLERYLECAMKEWLSRLFTGSGGSRSESGAAVRKLAALLARRHGDSWLMEFLATMDHSSFPAAVNALTGAIRANAEGNRDRGGDLAREAERLFAATGNTAGHLRARLELVYSLSRLFRSAECAEASNGLAARLRSRRYRWAYGQLQLERSTCAVRAGNLGEAQALLDDAIQQIKDSGYSTLLLRGLGFAANLQQALGRNDEANSHDWEGLALFWKGSHPPLRAYQFYANICQAAERERRWELGYLASREAVPMIELSGIPATEAMARYRVAMFAGATGRASQALADIRRAEASLDRIKGERATATLRAENQLLLASSYLDAGHPDLSSRVLAQVRAADLQDSIHFRLTYHRTKGSAAVRQGDLAQGRQELATALGLALGARQE